MKSIRNRNVKIQLWLNKAEARNLQEKARRSHLSVAAYLRQLINGVVPKEAPAPGLLLHDAGAALHREQSQPNCHEGPCAGMPSMPSTMTIASGCLRRLFRKFCRQSLIPCLWSADPWRLHPSGVFMVRVGKVLDYVENVEKTTAVSTGDSDLSDVIDYAIQRRKTRPVPSAGS